METIADVTMRRIVTPLGAVEVSLATHVDGQISIVAWLDHSGEQVGYLCHPGRGSATMTARVEAAFTTTALPAVLAAMLVEAVESRLRPMPLGERLVRAGLITDAERCALLGWQWLLDELGEHRRLGELTIEAGLVTRSALAAMMPPLVVDEAAIGTAERLPVA